jgi:hypothetical protein
MKKSVKKELDYIMKIEGWKSLTKVRWGLVSYRTNLTEDFMREFQDKLDWPTLSTRQEFSYQFIKEFKDKLDFDMLIRQGTITPRRVRELFREKVTIHELLDI